MLKGLLAGIVCVGVAVWVWSQFTSGVLGFCQIDNARYMALRHTPPVPITAVDDLFECTGTDIPYEDSLVFLPGSTNSTGTVRRYADLHGNYIDVLFSGEWQISIDAESFRR